MTQGEDSSARPADQHPQDPFLDQYTHVRHLARKMLLDQGARHSLGPTDLAHEAWLRLFGTQDTDRLTPEQFRALVTVTMRHALIDRARARRTHKRGGLAGPRLPLDALELASAERFEDLIAVDDAIERLRESHPGLAELVRLRFFAGLSVEETARALGTSERSVDRDWSYARAQLMRLLGGSGHGSHGGQGAGTGPG